MAKECGFSSVDTAGELDRHMDTGNVTHVMQEVFRLISISLNSLEFDRSH